ncbi:hypothetical protein [Noviluteimonas gilva]|uniref:Uncharacterized protein n=1 Tax=Noviluteimonas gilva TaxID=2682097 RepID=A0A7C9LI16_9GAMM|nr:hypothetical protein [Lysobacter gilvus]MUV13579.1 hypothetical protein [Lysobacter gilvus]
MATDANLTRKGRGRPKGSPNKLGKAAKDVIAEAAAELGGAERLIAWAKLDPLNERAFWATIYPKLLPLTVSGDPENPLGFQVVERRIVKPD